MSSAGTARSAVVYDRDPAWSESVGLVLERTGVRVDATATTVGQAISLLIANDPDLFVIAAENAGVEAARLVRRALEITGRASVIVLTEPGNAEQVERSLAAGAFAIIVKSASTDDVAVAARQAFAPSLYFAAPATAGNGAVAASGLTRREIGVLRLVAEGCSNGDIARELWVTEQTVKFHLSNVYRKLGVSNRTQAARWAATHELLD